MMTIPYTMQGVQGSTTQAEFTNGDYIIPKSHPAHLRASQTLHHEPLISLLPLISMPALFLLSLLHQTPLSPVPYVLYTPSCRVWESYHGLHGAEQEQTTQASALPQTKLPPLHSSAEFIPWGTSRGIRGHQPHTEGETSHVLQNNTLHRAASQRE